MAGEQMPSDIQADVLAILERNQQPFCTPEKRVAARMSPHWVHRYVPDGSPMYRIKPEGRAALTRWRENNQGGNHGK